jgi:hypothetical protein
MHVVVSITHRGIPLPDRTIIAELFRALPRLRSKRATD